MSSPATNPPLFGLVLAGGRSVRMGADKGSLAWGDSDEPQAVVALQLLETVCERAFISVSAEQAKLPLYADLPQIVDNDPQRGPGGGLQSAFAKFPDVAWLVLAVDMPRVSVALLRNLIMQRDVSATATVHSHGDGVIEPLCAIWEPAAADLLAIELRDGRGSLRRIAETSGAGIARLPEPDRLTNANTPEQRDALNRRCNRATHEGEC